MSIPMITPNVMLSHSTHPIIRTIILPVSIPPPSVFSKKTLASYPWANDRAHRRRYDAVFEIDPYYILFQLLPSTNSIVSIIWWTKISPNSNSPCPWPWPPPCALLSAWPSINYSASSAPSYFIQINLILRDFQHVFQPFSQIFIFFNFQLIIKMALGKASKE